jgi:hypothetical protein
MTYVQIDYFLHLPLSLSLFFLSLIIEWCWRCVENKTLVIRFAGVG